MITYEHERFISQAIDGVLMQETNFPIELIIANDHSPDGTDELVQNYINNHPKGNLIRYFHNEENIGMMPNFLFALSKPKGDYIALCEGDDYWTDPLKLQKQVDFLEENINVNLCFHQVIYVDANNKYLGNPQYQYNKDKSQLLSYEYLIENWCINTCSIVFRKVFEEAPAFLSDYKVGDQPLFYFINMGKDSYFIHDIMASYRIINLGFMGTVFNKELKSEIEFPFLDKINELSKNKYSDVIQRRKTRTIIRDLKFMKNSGKYPFFNRCKFYLNNFLYLFNSKNGIKVSIDSLFKYVI